MPIVKNMEGAPVTKTKTKKIGSVAGKEKITVKVAEISPKLKKNLNKITVVSKKIKVEKEKLKKNTPPKSKIVDSNKTTKKLPKPPKKPKFKSLERKNDKIEEPMSPKPKKIKKETKEPKEPKKKTTKTPKTSTKPDDPSKKKVETPKESKKSDENLKEPAEKPNKVVQKNEIQSSKPKVAKKSQESKIKKETKDSSQLKEPSTLLKTSQSIKIEEINSTPDKNEKIKKAKSKPKVIVDVQTAEKVTKTLRKPKTPSDNCIKPKKSKHIKEIDETELINNIIQKVKEDVAKTIKKENIIKTEPLESTETIAKLLKEANKSILKSAKKKPDSLKLNKTNAIQKKPKVLKKQKTVDIKQEYEEDVDLSELKQIAKALKAAKVIQKDSKNKIEDNKKTENPKKLEVDKNHHTDDSDELTLDVVRQNHKTESKIKPKDTKVTKKIKIEPTSDSEKKDKKVVKGVKKFKPKPVKKVISPKKKVVVLKKRLLKGKLKGLKGKDSSDDQVTKGKKIAKKLYNFWNGPKRRRVASLNAIAKVHCLYENESRGAMLDVMKRSVVPKETKGESVSSDPEPEPETVSEPTTRTLRSVPGLRGVGKHWEMNDDLSSFSSDNESSLDGSNKLYTMPPSYKQKQTVKKEKKITVKKETKTIKKKQENPEVEVDQDEEEEEEDEEEEEEVVEVEKDKERPKETKQKKKVIKKKRPRTELIMDLKDMVVRKRMASLNASAILAASYSVEKKPLRSPKTDESNTSDSDDESIDSENSSDKKRKCYDSDVKQEEDRKVIEVHASPNKKVAVILNQDTDVTITGVYVNSTTRSAHHEGYCSIAGMQYRISATSHTQTNATAVATETLLHSGTEHMPSSKF